MKISPYTFALNSHIKKVQIGVQESVSRKRFFVKGEKNTKYIVKKRKDMYDGVIDSLKIYHCTSY